MQTDTTKLDTDALFTQYVNVVNQAVGQNRDRFPFKQLLSMGDKILGDKEIGAAIYKTDADEPHDWFTLTFDEGKLDATHGKGSPDIEWKIDRRHLEHVVADPQPYIDNPARLDLDWLKTRMGDSES